LIPRCTRRPAQNARLWQVQVKDSTKRNRQTATATFTLVLS
jgi:hypothetical protein